MDLRELFHHCELIFCAHRREHAGIGKVPEVPEVPCGNGDNSVHVYDRITQVWSADINRGCVVLESDREFVKTDFDR